MSDDCLFCKISSGRLESEFLFEDEFCVAVRDIYPKANTHILIVSKKHLESVVEMEDEDSFLVGHMIFVSRLLSEKFNLKGYRLQINVGKDGGQEIFHLHVHLMSKF